MSLAETLPDYDGMLSRAFEGARLACGEPAVPFDAQTARVRVLAGAALFRGGFMPAKRAARDCHVGNQSRLSPGQLDRSGVTDDLVRAVIEFVRSGVTPAVVPDHRPGLGDFLNDPRLPEAKRLYVDEGLGLEETGRRLTPPLSTTSVHLLLTKNGVATRPRGTQGEGVAYKAGSRPAPTKHTSLRRFASPAIVPAEARDLLPNHPALSEARTIFPTTVVDSRASLGLLVSGHNNPKLGKEVLKGERAGWPIFHLTLEERATCPRSCPVWAGCYGNAMHRARRHRNDADLIRTLRAEVAAKAKLYPGGFLVRLHTLGDFYSVEYVLAWAEMLATTPALHVFGYTARREDDEDPETRKIARAIRLLTDAMWKRFAIRTSHAESGPQRSVVLMADPGQPDVIMCPAQSKATEACATCGLCWAGAARDKAIGFLKHGMTSRRGPRRAATSTKENDDGSGLKKDGWGNCQPRAEGTERAAPGAAGSPRTMRQAYSLSSAAVEVLKAPPGLAPAPAKPLRRPSVVTDAGRFVRMKPLNPDIIRWSGAYVARGVAIDYLADLFDVDADALGRAVAA